MGANLRYERLWEDLAGRFGVNITNIYIYEILSIIKTPLVSLALPLIVSARS